MHDCLTVYAMTHVFLGNFKDRTFAMFFTFLCEMIEIGKAGFLMQKKYEGYLWGFFQCVAWQCPCLFNSMIFHPSESGVIFLNFTTFLFTFI